jgi:hypothetical protein
MHRARVIAVVVLACFVLVLPSTALAAVKITEIFYNSPGSDTGSNKSLNAEWVKIHNSGSHAVRMHD